MFLLKRCYFRSEVELAFYVLSRLFLEYLQFLLVHLLVLHGLLVNVGQLETGCPLLLNALLEGLDVAPEHFNILVLFLE